MQGVFAKFNVFQKSLSFTKHMQTSDCVIEIGLFFLASVIKLPVYFSAKSFHCKKSFKLAAKFLIYQT